MFCSRRDVMTGGEQGEKEGMICEVSQNGQCKKMK